MAYLTENKLDNVLDIPVSIAATELKQGDWLVVATTKVVQPMLLTVRYMTLQILACSVAITNIAAGNRVNGNLGLVYLALRKDYTGGDPSAAGGVETLIATDLGIFARDTAVPLYVTAPGTYSWLIVNNMKADATSAVSTSTSIDFKLCINGQARLDLSNV
jgi:hypothetical protein